MKNMKLLLGMAAIGGAMLFGKQTMAAQTIDEYMEQAQEITLDTKVTEQIDARGLYYIGDNAHYDYGTKWYKITIPSDIGNKFIDLNVYNYAQDRLRIQIYDSSANDLSGDYFDVDSAADLSPYEERFILVGSENKQAEYVKLVAGESYYFMIESDGIEDPVSGEYIISTQTTADDSWGTFEQANEVTPGKNITGVFEDVNDVDSFCFTLPNDGKLYTITYGNSTNSDQSIGTDLYDKNQKELSPNAGMYKLTGNGQKYYLVVTGGYGGMHDASVKYEIPIKAELQKISGVSTQIKKGTKSIKVSSGTKNVTVKITCNKSIIKNGKKVTKTYTVVSKNGNVSVKASRKLAKGDKFTVTVSKKGYKTVKKTVTIK